MNELCLNRNSSYEPLDPKVHITDRSININIQTK
jgi:hypothetical protein